MIVVAEFVAIAQQAQTTAQKRSICGRTHFPYFQNGNFAFVQINIRVKHCHCQCSVCRNWKMGTNSDK